MTLTRSEEWIVSCTELNLNMGIRGIFSATWEENEAHFQTREGGNGLTGGESISFKACVAFSVRNVSEFQFGLCS